MIDVGGAAHSLGQETTVIESPAVVTSSNGDGHGTILQLGSNVHSCSSDLLGHANIDFSLISGWKSAVSIYSSVGVVSIGHGTNLIPVVPGVNHPATLATIGLGDAIDSLLFRKTNGGCTSRDGYHALQSGGSGKGPA